MAAVPWRPLAVLDGSSRT